MKIFNFSIAILFVFFLIGCGSSRLKPSDGRVTYEPKGDRTYSLFVHTGSSGSPRTQASIGDSLFIVTRYRIKDTGKPFVKNPWGDPYTITGKWYSAHSFTEGEKIYRVYTHDKFYEGSTGIILDENLRIPFYKAFVRLSGTSSGQRWKLADYNEIGKFFFIDAKIEERWGLRYSGKDGGFYLFDIYNRPDANVSTVTQSIKITEREFLDGFVVRGVQIVGKKTDFGGVINFSYTDKFRENLDADSEFIKELDRSLTAL